MSPKMKQIGMIGIGYWGKNLLRNLVNLNVIHTACDTNSDILKQRKKDFPDVRYSKDLKDILTHPEIKAVVISTPAATHYDLTQKALNAGKDVFVEKPLALTCAEGQKLLELAKEKNKILMVGHILQYHPAIIKLKELIEQGELGTVQYIYSNRLNLGKLRVEENILWSFAPHDISVLLTLTNADPIKVTCSGESYVSENIYDVTLTTLEFRNKIKAHIFVSWLHPFKEQKLVVVGSQAMAVFDDMTEEKLFLYPHKIQWNENKIPVAKKADRLPIRIPKAEPLKEELKHFLSCVATRQTPRTDGEEGLKVLKVLELAEKSLALKGEEILV